MGRLRFIIATTGLFWCSQIFAQPYYRVVSDNPDHLRSTGILMFGYGDFWRTNPSGGLGFGVMFHMKGVMQFEYGIHFATAEKLYDKENLSGFGRLVGFNGLFGVRLKHKDVTGRTIVHVNGDPYTMPITKRNGLWLRGGYSAVGSQYDGSLNAWFADSIGIIHGVDRNYLFDGNVVLGLSWKQIQNAWIEIGGGTRNPYPIGQYSELYFDALLLAGLAMGHVEGDTQRYEVQPGSKVDFGWRIGFRSMTSITTGFMYGLEGGMRPGPTGGKSMFDRNAYFVLTLGFYLAPGKRGR